MSRAALVGGLVVLGAGVAVALKNAQQTDAGGVGDFVSNLGDTLKDYGNTLDSAFGFIRASNVKMVNPSIVDLPNVRAMRQVIRQGESSTGPVAYQMVCGRRGAAFSSFADHPRPALPSPCSRGAAGAYQITIATWDWLRSMAPGMLPDFSPRSQDVAATMLMAYRGGLPAVVSGDLKTAFSKLRNEWTSLPGAAENGFTTFAGARQLFAQYGGSITDNVG